MRRSRAARSLRTWTDPEGAFRLDARLTPDAGATVLSCLEPFTDRMFSPAREQWRRESYEAYAADALVAMASAAANGGGAASKGPRARCTSGSTTPPW